MSAGDSLELSSFAARVTSERGTDAGKCLRDLSSFTPAFLSAVKAQARVRCLSQGDFSTAPFEVEVESQEVMSHPCQNCCNLCLPKAFALMSLAGDWLLAIQGKPGRFSCAPY